MGEIYFIRHGQASFGARNYDQLSPVGIRQAQLVADHLNTLDVNFDAVYCGRMKRQQDTARPFFSLLAARGYIGGDLTILPAFDEYDARSLIKARIKVSAENPPQKKQGSGVMTADQLSALHKDKKALQRYFSETVDRWISGDYDGVDGVETWTAFQGRVRGGVEDITGRHGSGSRVAVFTSGGPISVAVQMALEISDTRTVDLNWQIMNASLTCIKYNPTGLILSFFNNTAPLAQTRDPELLTYR